MKGLKFRKVSQVILISIGIVFLISCKHETSNNTTKTQKFNVSFHSGNEGKIRASLDDGTELKSPTQVEEGKIVNFTATPNPDYEVESWNISNGVFVDGGKPKTKFAKVRVKSNIDINVTYKGIIKTYSVTFKVEGLNGSIKASLDGKEIDSPYQVTKDKIVEFTAIPNDRYVVDRWTILGGSFENNSGSQGNTKANVKVNAEINVIVSFKINPQEEITITLDGKNEEITFNGDKSFKILRGSKWADVKADAENKITAKDGFKIIKWKLGKDGKVLTDKYIFSKDETIYAVTGKEILNIKIKVGEHIRISQENFTVPNPSLWAFVLEKAMSSIQFDTGWELKDWRLGSEGGWVLNKSSAPFEEDSIIYAQAQEAAQTIQEGVSLIPSPKKLKIKIKAITSDNSPISVEGCDKTSIQSGEAETLQVNADSKIVIKGNITKLDCSGNQLLALNIEGINSITELNCSRNQLTSLHVQNNSSLEVLNCFSNQLNLLDAHGLSNLKELNCYANQLISLNLQGCSSLISLACGGNQLNSLDVNDCTLLKTLNCYSNQLNLLDVSKLTALETLSCYSNRLTELNVQNLTMLKMLYLNANKISELDVHELKFLETLLCSSNKLQTLNVQNCSALRKLNCNTNQLTSLDVSTLTSLKHLYCNENMLESLDVTKLNALIELVCSYNDLTSLDVHDLPLQRLFCSNNNITSLNVQGLKDLQTLDCCANKLQNINIQDLESLQKLYLNNNKFDSQAFINIFNCLPQKTQDDEAGCYLYTEKTGSLEENHKDFMSIEELKKAFEKAKNDKHWTMYKYNAIGIEEEL